MSEWIISLRRDRAGPADHGRFGRELVWGMPKINILQGRQRIITNLNPREFLYRNGIAFVLESFLTNSLSNVWKGQTGGLDL